MKPVKFDYTLPAALMAVPALLAGQERVSKVVSGGQSLGAMLNLRLVQPDVLLDISGLAELKRIQETHDAWVIGACITHANIEDGCIAGKVGEVLASIARGIAYRAVRNRGTIGGSLAHADPSADWLCTLMALNTTIRLVGEAGARTLALD